MEENALLYGRIDREAEIAKPDYGTGFENAYSTIL